MTEIKDRGWDEMTAIWQAQPVPDVRKIAAQVQTEHHRLIRRQAHEIIGTIVMAAAAWAMFDLTPDAWFRAWFLVLAGYAILQQYLMLRPARGLFRKHDTGSVKDMLGHLTRYHRQRIYRSRLRLLETVVITVASVPLAWHLAAGGWGVWKTLIFAIMMTALAAFNLWFARRGMPRFRRSLKEAESLRRTLAGDE
jgi:fatty acid desaturase